MWQNFHSKISHRVAALLFILFPCYVQATHLRGGEITIKNLGCSMEFEITLTLYTNTASTAIPGGAILSLGDGSIERVPDLANTIIDAQYNIGKAVYVVRHTYEIPGSYLLGYSEANRNVGVLNFANSGSTPFYVESRLVIDNSLLCNNPVRFTIPPIDKACSGIAFTHNPGAEDLDGDSLSFQLIVPKRDARLVVQSYLPPNDPSFYQSFNYQHANEDKDGPPIFQLNPRTGTLVWDAPGMLGQFEITILVTEWKKSGTGWVNMGYVVRDIQIIVEDCHDTRPYMQIPTDVCVTTGTQLSQVIRGFDKEFDPVKIEVFTSDNFFSSPPMVSYQGVTQSTLSPFDTANVKITWNITCDLVRDQPYIIIFKITDLPPSGIRLASFYTWKVTVIGEAPQFKSLTLDPLGKKMKVEWQPYPCINAPTMEVWRRVSNNLIGQDPCSTGLTRAMGYEKIGVVTGSTFFMDNNLAPGAKYCYRLQAIFPVPHHPGISRASLESCIGPMVANAPVITNVSVKKTDTKNGEILVRWTSPFELDKIQFPPPYEYEVYRTTDGSSFVKALDHRITDTTLVDKNLNTRSVEFGYKIVLYCPSATTLQNPVDTSALAFYPRLGYVSGNSSIRLQWNATVPWSNQSPKYPWHYIYRLDNSVFTLIDSVDVGTLLIDTGFEYTDQGVYKNQPFSQDIVYQYKVQTRGVYGNPKIREPLQNFSNEIEAQIEDTSPPCKPVVFIEATDCENFLKNSACDISEYKNKLNWEYASSCGNDVSHYKIEFQNAQNGDFTLLGTTTDLSYVHVLQNSFSGCYRVIAVDRTGNESADSEPVCNENCPNIFIPNVFTPANDDGLNDFFPGLAAAGDDPQKCPRFVKFIDITIYNRWGQAVFLINSPFQGNIAEWTGLDSNGKELAAGVYFYEGNIAFDVMDESRQVKKLKGWVNLVR